MEKQKRTKLIVFGTIILVGSLVGAYFYFRKKKPDEQKPSGNSSGPPTSSSTTSQTSASAAPKKTSTPSAPSQQNAVIKTPIAVAVYSTGDGVNIRSAPSMSGKILGEVNKGDKVGVAAGKQVGDWLAIYSPLKNGVVSYINKQYAEIK